jgi:3-oxoacyl-[acyl-carrier protein] reductase
MDNIRINAVELGFIKIPMMDQYAPEVLIEAAEQHPIGRIGQPDEVAEIFALLLSDRALFVTGSLYMVDGGSRRCDASMDGASLTHGQANPRRVR